MKSSGSPKPASPLGAAASAALLAWVLLVRFSSAAFPEEAPVVASGILSLASLLVAAIALAAAALRARREEGFAGRPRASVDQAGALQQGWALPCAVALAACLALALPYLAEALSGGAWQPSRATTVTLALYAASGALLGLVLASVAINILSTMVDMGFQGFVPRACMALAAAFALFLAFAALVPEGQGWLGCALPLAFAALLGIDGRRRRVAGRRLGAEPAGSHAQRPAPAASPEGSGRLSGQAAAPEADPRPRRAARAALFVLAGFLFAYMPAMYPKTTNLAAWNLGPAQNIGLTSWRCVAALALLLALMALLAFVLDRRRRGAMVGAGAVVALFACICFVLPDLKMSPMAFVLTTPVASVLALCLAGAACMGGMPRALRACAAMAAGAACAGAFAFVFLGPLYGAAPIQDALFFLVPAVVLVACAVLALPFEEELSALLFPTSSAEGERLVSETDRLCSALAARLGLTARESQVLALIAEGRNEPYIEKALSVSRATVKTHISHIYRKAGVSSRQELLDLLLASR